MKNVLKTLTGRILLVFCHGDNNRYQQQCSGYQNE